MNAAAWFSGSSFHGSRQVERKPAPTFAAGDVVKVLSSNGTCLRIGAVESVIAGGDETLYQVHGKGVSELLSGWRLFLISKAVR